MKQRYHFLWFSLPASGGESLVSISSRAMRTPPYSKTSYATKMPTVIWDRSFLMTPPSAASPTSQLRKVKLRGVQLLRMFPVHRNRVHDESDASPSPKKMWTSDFGNKMAFVLCEFPRLFVRFFSF